MTAKEIPTIPLAPEDLRRAYADIAYGYHVTLPRLAEEARQAKEHALAAFELAGELVRKQTQIEAQLIRIASAMGIPIEISELARSKFPGPPRAPTSSASELEPDEVTIIGQKRPVVHGEVSLTVSEISALKRTMSVAQKVLVAILAGAVLSLGALVLGFFWREAKTYVVQTPPVVVMADAGQAH